MILSSHGIIGSSIVQINTLLDLYPNAAAAYSLRKLRSAYTGSAIRVRIATTGNPEYNIGFVNNELDVATLEGYCTGGLNAFVKTWYDQSNNGRDATQETAANQPQIVSSGSVLILNGKPTMQFDGINDGLDTPALTLSNNSYFGVYKQNVETISGNFGYVYTDLSIAQNLSLYDNNTSPNENKRYVFNDPNVLFDGVSTNSQELMSQFYPSSSPYLDLYINSSAQTFSNLPNSPISISSKTLSLMYLKFTSGTAHFTNGNMQEFIIYNSNQSSNRTGIETNINDFYSIY